MQMFDGAQVFTTEMGLIANGETGAFGCASRAQLLSATATR
ncbi:MAG: hypothetical protein R2932_01015 [Caldilineaceae bacterium]